LSDAGCAKIFSEQRSRTPAGAPDALQRALDFVRGGDTLVVTQLDRFARSPNDIHGVIARLTGSGVSFRCLQQSHVDPDGGHESPFWPSLAVLLPSLKGTSDESASAIGQT
jgi:DNA invertase Pin-like site-specific DNA recombinase